MEIISTLARWREFASNARGEQKSVALVPTMGALHEGHVSLIRTAKRECDTVIVTIFVNPRQFNDVADLTAYPRTLDVDLALSNDAGADAVVTPSLDEMWPKFPEPTSTTVSVIGVGDVLEGADRPGHFNGVASVVAKLFNVTGPCHAYFGEKDFQQLAVVRQLVSDLAFDVDIVGCAIVRDADGLALSSRNVRLSPAGRTSALAIPRAIEAARKMVGASADDIRTAALTILRNHVDVAYVEVVEPSTLTPYCSALGGPARILIAGIVDGVRLLDNGEVTVGPSKGEISATGN